MNLQITFLMLFTLSCCDGVNVYSSFWAPLFDPKILNYRVDANYDPEAGKTYRHDYEQNYGYRGQKLISDLGNGMGPHNTRNEVYEKVKFYYTYPRVGITD